MRWLKEFHAALAEGRNTFLFTGNVSDGFPGTASGASALPHLQPWSECLSHEIGKSAVVWTYDVALGFRFATEDDEIAFRAKATGQTVRRAKRPSGNAIRALSASATASGGRSMREDIDDEDEDEDEDEDKKSRNVNPIEAAREQIASTAPLPVTDAVSALTLMHRYFSAASAKGTERGVAILPDIDACVAQSAVGDRTSSLLALLVSRFAESGTFHRHGHLLLMSAPSARSLDERLTRPDAPVKLIHIPRPDASERRTYVSAITSLSETTTRHLAAQQAKLERLQTAERAKRERAVKGAQERLHNAKPLGKRPGIDAVVAHPLVPPNTLKLIKRLLRESVEKRAVPHQTIQRLPTLSPARFKKLRQGDLITCILKDDGYACYRVGRKIGDGICLFSQSSNLSGWDLITYADRSSWECTLERMYIHQWRSGKLVRRKQHEEGEWKPAPLNAGTVRVAVMSRREYDLLEHLEDLDAEILKRAAEARDAADVIMTGQENALERLKKTATETEMHTDAIDKLAADIRALTNHGGQEANAYPQCAPAQVDELVQATVGFGFRDLDHLLKMMKARKIGNGGAELLAHRQELLRRSYGELFDIVEPSYGFEGIAGLTHVKRFFIKARDAIAAGDFRSVPMGCMLMGPPGTGKTAVAEAFAKECGFLFVKIKNVRDMFVGRSEQLLEKAIGALRDLAPVVVLRDEVDEEDSGRDSYQGDTGVSGRLRRMWMEFLSDPKIRGRVFVISCSNRPDRLDAAFKRSGRTDERLPLLMPDYETRKALFPVMIKRSAFTTKLRGFAAYAEMTEGLTGADIEVIVRRAHGRSGVTDKGLREATHDFIPSASIEAIAQMTLIALRETSSRDHLPPDASAIEARMRKMLEPARP